ncbi:DEP domain-containing mTOR-interacting protein [Esox lucius]|uniref:DEP domain containing MTOR-interacting protein n=1 Tax=Esox lucius TaxID=8010 RepID=A0AAY5KN18_ESOLU|nr:DEP domain-containing mTOR-interacting protein [Esox lucius]
MSSIWRIQEKFSIELTLTSLPFFPQPHLSLFSQVKVFFFFQCLFSQIFVVVKYRTTLSRRTLGVCYFSSMVFASRNEMDGIGNTMQKKAAELERMAEVLVTGEQLRLRLHEGKVIKDRRHHLRTYPNCFVAKELIDWLLEHKEASDRDTAIKIMQKLLDQSIIHHVCDEHKEFKDMKLFYRFRKDDGTFPLDNEAKVFMRGQRIYEKLMMNTETSIIATRQEEGETFERTLVASEFVDWLLAEGEMATREEAEQLGRRLLEHGIMQHVTNKHHFVDGGLLYQFRLNFRRRRRLMELLNERCRTIPESHESPFCLRKQNSEGGNTSFLSVSPTKEIKVMMGVRRSSMSSSCGSSGYYSSSPPLSGSPPVLCNPKSVLKRQVSPEELQTPGGPYIKKTFTIMGDAVGWGFVVRGSKPCHIQAVDPSGPAAAAGMKVCQFVVSVNGLNVLPLDYRTVSNLILTGPRTVVMEVMEEADY